LILTSCGGRLVVPFRHRFVGVAPQAGQVTAIAARILSGVRTVGFGDMFISSGRGV
jgi:hypothetical protein